MWAGTVFDRLTNQPATGERVPRPEFMRVPTAIAPGHIQRDAGEPRSNLGWVAQLIQAEHRLQRGFLHDVLETVARAKQSLAYAAHQRQVAGKQVRKSLLVGCPSTLHQRRVVVCHNSSVPRDSATGTRQGYPRTQKVSAASGDAA